MPKQKQAVAEKSGRTSRKRVKPLAVEELTDDRTGLAQLPTAPVAAAGDGPIKEQEARLGDLRLQTIQRRALAARIGRMLGNRYLQRMIASLRTEEDTPDSKPICQQAPAEPVIQRLLVQDHIQGAIESGSEMFARISRKQDGGKLPIVQYPVLTWQQSGMIQKVNGGGGGGGAPAAAPPRPTSAEETIARAIAIFMASATSNTRLGRQVLRKLIELHGESEIGFAELEARPGSITHAESREGISSWGRVDIAVNEHYRLDVIRTSLRLVHEAIHQIHERPYVDEELTARNLQIDYYTELEGGIPFGRSRYQAAAGLDPHLEEQRRFRARNQLVDYIINISTYSESLEVEWVRSHIRDWGELGNRWRHTKGRYIQVLSEEPADNAPLLLDILESETSADGCRLVANWAGGGDFNRGLTRIREAIRRGYLLYSTPYYRRIEALQTTFNVDLGIPRRPPSGE